ncbi:SpoIIE family protein phosphatase [Quadrisphaera sp. DSM 44207]|uniref:SpoIIE family protein phosphatase n=1 Tax=Quadrisphaera sp. DSM 44207 TaxID=1881057 RepID=UPI002100D1A3|nr:SpoIIE family protein phosphatase [Quadrisphaera sp. DSM 44207]
MGAGGQLRSSTAPAVLRPRRAGQRAHTHELQHAAGPEPGLPARHLHAGAGDCLLLLTDGLLEARDAGGTMLPPGVLTEALRADGVDAVVDAVVRAALEHAGGRLDDDVAVLACQMQHVQG